MNSYNQSFTERLGALQIIGPNAYLDLAREEIKIFIHYYKSLEVKDADKLIQAIVTDYLQLFKSIENEQQL